MLQVSIANLLERRFHFLTPVKNHPTLGQDEVIPAAAWGKWLEILLLRLASIFGSCFAFYSNFNSSALGWWRAFISLSYTLHPLYSPIEPVYSFLKPRWWSLLVPIWRWRHHQGTELKRSDQRRIPKILHFTSCDCLTQLLSVNIHVVLISHSKSWDFKRRANSAWKKRACSQKREKQKNLFRKRKKKREREIALSQKKMGVGSKEKQRLVPQKIPGSKSKMPIKSKAYAHSILVHL